MPTVTTSTLIDRDLRRDLAAAGVKPVIANALAQTEALTKLAALDRPHDLFTTDQAVLAAGRRAYWHAAIVAISAAASSSRTGWARQRFNLLAPRRPAAAPGAALAAVTALADILRAHRDWYTYAAAPADPAVTLVVLVDWLATRIVPVLQVWGACLPARHRARAARGTSDALTVHLDRLDRARSAVAGGRLTLGQQLAAVDIELALASNILGTALEAVGMPALEFVAPSYPHSPISMSRHCDTLADGSDASDVLNALLKTLNLRHSIDALAARWHGARLDDPHQFADRIASVADLLGELDELPAE
jgi:hypothetical protein